MNVAVHGLALAALLCPLSMRAESSPLEPLQSPELGEKVERLVPGPAKDPARKAVERAQEAVGGDQIGGPFSLGAFDRHAPVVINADELEASEESGRREIVFRRHVVARQGSLSVGAARLSAVYPKDAKQPSRLEASGGVVVREGDREARCERAVYDRVGRKLDCIGKASLRDGDDRLTGDSIAFDLERRSVRVGGGSELWFEPPPESAAPKSSALPMPWLGSESPVRIRAARLDAIDTPEGRRILFEGDVEVEQKGGVLRAQRLEAVYPPDGKQPDKLMASGEVSLTEGTREARCESAEYLRLESRVRCLGGVATAQGDRLEGDVIDFTLGQETLAVRGRTRLVLGPRNEKSATP